MAEASQVSENGAQKKALLVGVCKDAESAARAPGLLNELAELVASVGMLPAEKIIARISEMNAQFLVGRGKFEQIVAAAKNIGAECVVFDDPLTPAQQRNWEREGDICVIDRQEVILDIFAARARTKEARLQVELAQLEYSLPRLKRAWTHLSRQRGGGVTQRGEGESQLELDQRLIRERISKLKVELEAVSGTRQTQRKRRMRMDSPSAAIVGYTNAGKSSLLNRLCGSCVLVQNKLFATLDPTTRRVDLPDGGNILLTDTVGFVRKLPHQFVEAFKATLEEAVFSDFLLHIVDASNPDAEEHITTTNAVLKELGADEKKIVIVYNKSDLCHDEIMRARLKYLHPDAIFMSVKSGEGVDALLHKLAEMTQSTHRAMRLLIPHSAYKLIGLLYECAAIKSQKHEDAGVMIEALLPTSRAHEFEKFALRG